MLPAAHAVLDMAAIAHNIQRIRHLAPHSKIMAVIKANAYGHGLLRYARALASADAFAVARIDEGLALREAGIEQRIVVLQGFNCSDELVLHSRHQLEPVVHSLHQIALLQQVILERQLAVWLKLDSGMHRLGVKSDEFEAAHSRLSQCRWVKQPISLMTHLANADGLGDPATERQVRLFLERVAGLPGDRSIANSAGVFAWEQARTEWVRPGIALYGVSPFPERTAAEDGLRPVMTLRTHLLAIKQLATGDAIGYGGDWVCPRPTRMGVAAIGYGDGYPRHAGSGTSVLIGDQRVPLIGRVSMDMISVDLTDCPRAQIGDYVTLWGDQLPVEEVARHARTIPYHLLCGVTARVKMMELYE